MEPAIFAYEIVKTQPVGWTNKDSDEALIQEYGEEWSIRNLGQIVEIYKKVGRGVHCFETELEFFKVDRPGNIIPANRQALGEIVLSYDSTFTNGQSISEDDYIQLTDCYKLNIKEIYNE